MSEQDYRAPFEALSADLSAIIGLLGFDRYSGVDPVLRRITELLLSQVRPDTALRGVTSTSHPAMIALDKQCRDDVARAIGLTPTSERDFAWSYLLDRVKRKDSELVAEIERLKGITPALPPRPPEGDGLPRYGLRWNGPSQPLAVPMGDGYWTPWHLASKAVDDYTDMLSRTSLECGERLDAMEKQLSERDALLRDAVKTPWLYDVRGKIINYLAASAEPAEVKP